MRPALLVCLACSLAAGPPAAPKKDPPKPAKPADTRVRDGLVNGSIRFLVPKEWEIEERADTGFQVRYRTDAESASKVGIMVTQQAQGIPVRDPRVKQALVKYVLEQAAEDLKRGEVEVVDPPKVEVDDRFMVRVRERYKEGGTFCDRVHLYRGLGFNLIDVTVTAATEDKEEARKLHDAGATVLMSVTVGPKDPKIIRAPKNE